jgi:hypothetical protein
MSAAKINGLDYGHYPRLASIRLGKPIDQVTPAEINAVKDEILLSRMGADLPGRTMVGSQP